MRLFDLILSRPTEKWDFSHLSRNPNLSVYECHTLLEKIKEIYLSAYDAETIDKFISKFNLSWNPHITMLDVLSNLKYNWNWRSLSMHRNISINDIESYPCFTWDYEHIAQNPNLTETDVARIKLTHELDYMSDPDCKGGEDCNDDYSGCRCFITRTQLLYNNPNLPITFFLKLRREFYSIYKINSVCKNPNFTLELTL